MSDDMFSRDEVQGGSVGRVRRARALVYLIEQEATRSRDRKVALTSSAMPDAGLTLSSVTEADPELMRRSLPGEADAAFIESFRNARRHAHAGRVRSLDANVASWKVLVPEDIELRAEVLHQLSIRHGLPVNRTRSLASAFGVGTAEFDAAYLRVTGSPVASAFSAPTGVLAALRARFGAK
ncbi:MAG: hypothetical protein ACO3C1_07125 [Ilumatobacteraceae bacterium]